MTSMTSDCCMLQNCLQVTMCKVIDQVEYIMLSDLAMKIGGICPPARPPVPNSPTPITCIPTPTVYALFSSHHPCHLSTPPPFSPPSCSHAILLLFLVLTYPCNSSKPKNKRVCVYTYNVFLNYQFSPWTLKCCYVVI